MGLLPFTHSFGLTACLNWPMSQGAMIIVLPRFEIGSFLKAMQKYRPTMLPGVPTLFVALINDPRLPKLDLSALWACISGSAPLPQEVQGPLRGVERLHHDGGLRSDRGRAHNPSQSRPGEAAGRQHGHPPAQHPGEGGGPGDRRPGNSLPGKWGSWSSRAPRSWRGTGAILKRPPWS